MQRIGKPNIQGYDTWTLVHKPRHENDQYPWLRENTGQRLHHADVREINYSPEFKLGDDGPRTGEGSGLELAIAATVAHAIAQYYSEPIDNFFVAGHEHEGLSKGAVSVAWKGGSYEWTYGWPKTDRAQAVAAELGVWFKPINGCILGVYPKD